MKKSFKPQMNQGFTLIELVVTLVIMAIMASIAMPSYKAMIQDNAQVARLNSMTGIISLTRSEAIKRNTDVSICVSLNGTTCELDNANWSSGVLVFLGKINEDPPARYNPQDIIQVITGDSDYSLKNTQNQKWLTYNSKGIAVKGGGSQMIYCDDRKESNGKMLRISPAGRTSVKDLSLYDCNADLIRQQ